MEEKNKWEIYDNRLKLNEDGTLARDIMALVMADAMSFNRRMYLLLNARENSDV